MFIKWSYRFGTKVLLLNVLNTGRYAILAGKLTHLLIGQLFLGFFTSVDPKCINRCISWPIYTVVMINWALNCDLFMWDAFPTATLRNSHL